MPVDPGKTRKILVVHGVQTGTDEDLDQHELIDELVRDRLNNINIDFKTELYAYENINDKAQKKYKRLLGVILSGLIAKVAAKKALDLIGDVVIALNDDSTAAKIRKGLTEKILDIYEEGNPLFIVAHSLGSIYAFDVVNALMKRNDLFDRNSRETWPVQALVTMGSPIGLKMFKRNKIYEMGDGRHFFRWINYWDRTDPVVSGSFYGKPLEGYHIVERFTKDMDASGWFIKDRVVDVGHAWLRAHTGYWRSAPIGDDLAALITT